VSVRRDTLRAELENSLRERVAAKRTQRDVNLRVLQRAAVDATKLTESEEWDIYLQQVQALNEQDVNLLLCLPTASDLQVYQTAEECQRNEFERALLRARIHARNECIEIPKRILQGAAESRD
jgi:hypothetical protein